MKAILLSCLCAFIFSCTTKQDPVLLELSKEDMGESLNLRLTITNIGKNNYSFESPSQVAEVEERFSLDEEFKNPLKGEKPPKSISGKMYTLKPGESREFSFMQGILKEDIKKRFKYEKRQDWFVRAVFEGCRSNSINLKISQTQESN